MQQELKAFDENNTWELVSLPHGKKAIGSKWVYKVKLRSDGSLERHKARLIAKGYHQQHGISKRHSLCLFDSPQSDVILL